MTLLTFPAAGSIKAAAFWTRLETVFRQMGYDVYCGPSYVAAGHCRPGRHPHGATSRHFVARALDVGFDPPSGAPESNYEKSFLDVTVRMMETRYPAMFKVWNRGPGDHRDHAHFDDQTGYPTEVRYTGHKLPAGIIGFGKVGDDVRDLQLRLNTRGARLTVDGALGLATFDALRRFQYSAGLVPDGLAGPATRAALKPPTPPAPPRPSPPPVPPLAERVRPHRIAGADAYATATALDAATLPPGRGVLLAARDSPDLVAAGAAAGRRTDVSVLPVRPGSDSLPGAVAARIRTIAPRWLRIIGGPSAVPDRAAADALDQANL